MVTQLRQQVEGGWRSLGEWALQEEEGALKRAGEVAAAVTPRWQERREGDAQGGWAHLCSETGDALEQRPGAWGLGPALRPPPPPGVCDRPPAKAERFMVRVMLQLDCEYVQADPSDWPLWREEEGVAGPLAERKHRPKKTPGEKAGRGRMSQLLVGMGGASWFWVPGGTEQRKAYFGGGNPGPGRATYFGTEGWNAQLAWPTRSSPQSQVRAVHDLMFPKRKGEEGVPGFMEWVEEGCVRDLNGEMRELLCCVLEAELARAVDWIVPDVQGSGMSSEAIRRVVDVELLSLLGVIDSEWEPRGNWRPPLVAGLLDRTHLRLVVAHKGGSDGPQLCAQGMLPESLPVCLSHLPVCTRRGQARGQCAVGPQVRVPVSTRHCDITRLRGMDVLGNWRIWKLPRVEKVHLPVRECMFWMEWLQQVSGGRAEWVVTRCLRRHDRELCRRKRVAARGWGGDTLDGMLLGLQGDQQHCEAIRFPEEWEKCEQCGEQLSSRDRYGMAQEKTQRKKKKKKTKAQKAKKEQEKCHGIDPWRHHRPWDCWQQDRHQDIAGLFARWTTDLDEVCKVSVCCCCLTRCCYC